MGIAERTQDKDIDGTIYRVTPLPFGIGQKALVRLLKVIAPVMAAALEQDTARILETLPAVLTEEDLAWFAAKFGDASFYKEGGNWVPLVSQNQEIHFAGRYETFFRWLKFSVEVNFAGFFSGVKNANLAEKVVSLTNPVTTSSTA